LRDKKPYKERPNAHLKPVKFNAEFADFVKKYQPGFLRTLEITDFLSWKLYPKVFEDALEWFKNYGDVSKIPTPNFFYGLKENEECIVEIAQGKSIIVKLLSIGPSNDEGMRTVFFKVNGQTRNIEIADKSLKIEKITNRKADSSNNKEVAAPLQGLLSKVLIKKGQTITKNEPLFIVEAMKMESTITSNDKGKIKEVVLPGGSLVNAGDLVLIYE